MAPPWREGYPMLQSEPAALIMAGGRSERMRASGAPEHKGLRTVLGLPLVECNLRALLHFGFRRLFVAVNESERELLGWIDGPGRKVARQRAATLDVLVESQPRGTIGAVAGLPGDAGEVVIVNVDNLTSLDLPALIARLLDAGGIVHAHPHADGWIDVNDEAALARAQALVAGNPAAWPWLCSGGTS